MSSGRTRFSRLRGGSYGLSYDTMEEREVDDNDGEEWEGEAVHRTGNSILFSAQHEGEDMPATAGGRQDVGDAMTPASPGHLLGDY